MMSNLPNKGQSATSDPISASSQHESNNNDQRFEDSEITTTATRSMMGNEASQSPPVNNPGFMKRAWKKLGIDPFAIVFMVKPALAVTIGAAIYQKPSVAAQYVNFGYLIMIVSVLTVPMLPRGKFLMNLFLTTFMICFAAAMVLFGQWCAIKARQNTTPAGAPLLVAIGYNSSAAVVNAIFLTVNIFGISVLRAARPAFSVPSVVYTVFVLIGFVYGPQQYSEFRSKKFVQEVFYAFLTGQGISAGVSLIIIPVSSRKVFFGETAGFLQNCRTLLKAHQEFIEALTCSEEYDTSPGQPGTKERQETSAKQIAYKSRAKELKASATGLLALGAKLREDVVFAKREIAFGHLASGDIHQLHQHLRSVMIPISGLSTLADISERLKSCRKKKISTNTASPINVESSTENEQERWRELIAEINPSFRQINEVLAKSIVHVLVLLKLGGASPKSASKVAGSSRKGDLEMGNQNPLPGDIGFGDYLEQQMIEFRQVRTAKLKEWAEQKGLSASFQTSAEYWSSKNHEVSNSHHLEMSQRLHMVLYMEYLLYSVSKSVLSMVRFAEAKVNDGTMSKSHLIFPTFKTLRKLAKGLIRGEDSSPGVDRFDHVAGNVENVHLGDALLGPKDPEHLPPKNKMQVFGNALRKVSKLLGSDSAKFGFRVVVAVMSISIMAYVKTSRPFFIRQRVVWGVVMIAIGMSPTSGSAVFNLLGNLTATLVGMTGSFINWYIVDQKTAGVIVLLFFFMAFYFYFAAKNPRFLVAIVAGAVTHILIIGNELQVRVLGKKIYTATGTPYYPLYELAPYRLLTVGGGCLVAYIWTVFPVPITEGSVLRKDAGSSLFLLAKYVSSVTSLVDQRLSEQGGDEDVSSIAGRKLEKTCLDILAKQIVLLNSMRQNLAFMAWEPRLGGDFPKKTYGAIINEIQNSVNYLTIISYASEAFTAAKSDPSTSTWLSSFSRSRYRTDHKSHKIASLLTLLSASIRNNQALAPYTKAPTHFPLAESTDPGDTHVLGLHNIDEPGFRAVAVVEVAHECLVDSVGVIVGLVRELVGELDFSYGVMNSKTTSNGSKIGVVEVKRD